MYSLSRPRSRGRKSSLVGDSGQVLGVLGWALTRMRNLLHLHKLHVSAKVTEQISE